MDWRAASAWPGSSDGFINDPALTEGWATPNLGERRREEGIHLFLYFITVR
jgi:hypothetical protein